MDERLTRSPQLDEKYFQAQARCSPGFVKLFRGHSNMKLLSQLKLWSRNSGGWGCKGDWNDVVPPSDGNRRVIIDKVENNVRHVNSRNSHGRKLRKHEKSAAPQLNKSAEVTSTEYPSKVRAFQSKICSKTGNICQECIHRQKLAARLGYPQCYYYKGRHHKVKSDKVDKESRSVVIKGLGNRRRGAGYRSIGCNGELDKMDVQPTDVNEMIEALIDQKFRNQNHFRKSRASHECQQFWDALQILNSNKEVLWKPLDDPDSLLAKHIRELQDSQAKEQHWEPFSGIKKLQDSKKQTENSVGSYFDQKESMLSRSWKRFKSWNKILTNRRDDADASNRVMILKPVPESIFEINFNNYYTSLKLAYALNMKVQATKRSRFFFGHMRRKLKLASGIRRKRKKHLLSTSFRLHGHPHGWKKTKGDAKGLMDGIRKENYPGGVPPEATATPISELSSKKDMDKALPDENPHKVLIRSFSLPEYNFLTFLVPETREHKYDDPGMSFFLDKSYQSCDERRLRLCRDRKNTFVKVLRPNVDALALDIVQKLEELHQYPRTKTDAAPENAQKTQATIVTTCPDENSYMEGQPQQSRGLDISVFRSPDTAFSNEKDLLPEGLPLLSSSCDSSRILNIENQEYAVHNAKDLRPITKPVIKELSREVAPNSISTISRPGKRRKQLPRIGMDEPRSICAQGIPMEQPTSASNSVREFLLTAGLTWDDLFEKGQLSDQLLRPALLNELEARRDQTGLDSWMLFDYINEVLMEVHQCYFGCSPFLSFLKQNSRTIPSANDVGNELIKGWIDWDLILQIPSQSLEQLMKRDLKRCRSWMDDRTDAEGILSEMADNILEDMIKELQQF